MSRRKWSVAVLAIFVVTTLGCGGETEADMRRRSRKRKPAETPTAATTAAPAATDGRPTVAPAATPSPASPTSVAPPPPPQQPEISKVAATAAVQSADTTPLVMNNSSPAQPMSEAGRYRRSVDNLAKINAALKAFLQRNGVFPSTPFGPPAKANAGLSWRVELLPDLGYEQLYRRFDLTAAWDAPQNQALLKFIPPEYQSPERFDEKTNYLLVAGEGSLRRRIAPADMEDGPGSTIILVECDDTHAVPWTQPTDLNFDRKQPKFGLGSLRPAGFLAVMGSLETLFITTAGPNDRIAGLFTENSGDPTQITEVGRTPAAVVLPETISASPPSATTTADAPMQPGKVESPAANSGPLQLPASFVHSPKTDVRSPVPSEADRKNVSAVFRELYKEDLERSFRQEDRVKLIAKLLKETTRIDADETAYYVLNDVVRKMASAAGELKPAWGAIRNLETRFQVDGVALRLEALTQILPTAARDGGSVGGSGGGPTGTGEFAAETERLFWSVLEQDDFAVAFNVLEIRRLLAVHARDRAFLAEFASRRRELEAAREAFQEAAAAAKTLETSPADPQANESVGKYVALVKQSWDVGLPLMAKGVDVRLRFVATIDGEPDKSPTNQVLLADKWWELSEEFKPPFRRGAALRASHWYQAALPGLPGGLTKLRVEQRLSQMKKFFPEITLPAGRAERVAEE